MSRRAVSRSVVPRRKPSRFSSFARTRYPTSPWARMGRPIGPPRAPRWGTSTPQTMTVTLKYAERIVLDAAGGVAATYQFKMNDLFDPNLTSTGHQPAGYDIWTSLYTRWIVTRNSIKVTAWPTVPIPVVSGQSSDCIVALIPQRTASTSTDVLTNVEQDMSKTMAVGFNSGPRTLSNSCDIAAIAGIDPIAIRNNEYYVGAVGTTPALTPIWNIVVGASNSGINVEPISLLVEMWFQATFFNPDVNTAS